jgi:uracil-DNA glycosylase
VDFRLEKSWAQAVGSELDQPYMHGIKKFLAQESQDGHVVYPPSAEIFNALHITALEDVRVVILGQDPYHGAGQAHGLSFSVRDGVARPPSLLNIYKEISREYGCPIPDSGDLTRWARQGVLLLNTVLTVRQDEAGSHRNQGWEKFTDAIIRTVSDKRDHVVFMLWGAHAREKAVLIDAGKHLVLEAPHPSPLSAHRGFIGCGHFRLSNEYLMRNGKTAVDWTA